MNTIIRERVDVLHKRGYAPIAILAEIFNATNGGLYRGTPAFMWMLDADNQKEVIDYVHNWEEKNK